jgi:hypothetical protein
VIERMVGWMVVFVLAFGWRLSYGQSDESTNCEWYVGSDVIRNAL